MQVGWSYDEANQANPAILNGPLQVVRDYAKKSGGSVSAEIVNLDIPVADRYSCRLRAVTVPGIMSWMGSLRCRGNSRRCT